MHRTSPTPNKTLRRLNAMMEEKWLDLREVSKKAKVNYTVASAILNGRLVRPQHLRALGKIIEAAKTPEGSAA